MEFLREVIPNLADLMVLVTDLFASSAVEGVLAAKVVHRFLDPSDIKGSFRRSRAYCRSYFLSSLTHGNLPISKGF